MTNAFSASKQTRWLIADQLPDERGTTVTISDVKREMLKDFNSGEDASFIVLHFKECKPLVCKNPVLDSLALLFPKVTHDKIESIIGQQIVLHGVHGSSGKNDWYVVRIDEVASLRLQTPGKMPGDPIRDDEPSSVSEDVPPPDDNDEPPF